MEYLTNEHGAEVFILRETPPPGAAVRPLASLRVTVPDNGEPWPVVIRDHRGKPVTGLWASEADMLVLARVVIERRGGNVEFLTHGHGSAVDAAAEFLIGAGLTVHDRSWCCDDGGISIVAEDHAELVAVYLKMAAGDGVYYSGALDQLDEKTVTEQRSLAVQWCAEHNRLFPKIRVDVIGMVRRPGGWVIEHARAVA